MSLALILNVLLVMTTLAQAVVIPQVRNHFSRGSFTESQTNVLLQRLDHAKGNERQLDFLKIILLSHSAVGACKEQNNCVSQLIDAVEEIVLLSDMRWPNCTRLREAKHYIRQLQTSDESFRGKLESLPAVLNTLYGDPLRASVSSYLSYQIKELRIIYQHVLLADTDDLTWVQVGNAAARCHGSMQSGLKTLELLAGKSDAIKQFVRSITSLFKFRTESNFIRHVFEKLDSSSESLRPRDVDEALPRDIQGDMKFLRDSLAVTLRAGMFMILCMHMHIYACTFVFGALVSVSSFIWITVYLDMLSNAV
ncbi:(ZYRO0C06248g) [Zygosaccharomyces parabailii]|nr:(ZYRO0C06248g) [Zygosaccharomyces parabailii]